MEKTYKRPDGKEIDLGIYANLSKAGMKELQAMMNATSPRPKRKEVKRKKDHAKT